MMKSTWILALVWVLVLLASPLYAGHALNSPVATTNPGDFWCSGNADFDGTVVFDGVCTFNTNAIFLQGASIQYDLTVNTLDVTEITCDGIIVVDDVTVADDLAVTDDATISGELKGARCLLGIGSNAGNLTVDDWLRGSGFGQHSNTMGYLMTRAGSIVGATFMYNIDSYTPVATLELEVRKNDVVVYSLVDTIAATGVGSMYDTQARGTDTFVAGDIIAARIDVTGTIQYDMYGGYIEVQFDD